jgi:protein-S-isoprenylcysteine O-methyltransferase Ste14
MMVSNSAPQTENSPSNSLLNGLKVVIIFFLFVGSAFFISYGSFRWWEAWLLIVLWGLYFLFMLTVGRKLNPEVVEERAQATSKFTQRWDRIIISLYQVFSAGIYIVAGLDRGRFSWTGSVPPVVKWAAFVFVLGVYAANTWAVMSNPFASGVVRIQQERGHEVVVAGPYRFVRHPMYLNTLIFAVSFPLFLESYWALLPGLGVIVLFVLRAGLEDRYLKENLPGYKDYARQVRYRLFPGIW